MPDVHEFFTRQHERLNKLETSIVQTQAELDAARTERLESLQSKREQAAANREAFQKKITDSLNQMSSTMDAQKQETQAVIDGWKRDREISKLDSRAKNLEEYAEAAAYVVEVAQEEAKAASLAAIEARRQADEVKAAGTTA